MMTHGFCQNMPLGYGNCTWYTGQNKDFVVLEEIPIWIISGFYDPSGAIPPADHSLSGSNF